MFSLGMFSFLPASMAARRRGLELGSPPPMRAAMVISRITRVNTRPRFASVAAFLCLIVAHFECPDMTNPRFDFCARWRLFQIASRSAAVYVGDGSPGHRPTRARGRYTDHGAETYVNCKTLRNPSSLAQPAT